MRGGKGSIDKTRDTQEVIVRGDNVKHIKARQLGDTRLFVMISVKGKMIDLHRIIRQFNAGRKTNHQIILLVDKASKLDM